jgi:hypothetical protein
MNGKMTIMNNDLGRICEEVVETYFKTPSRPSRSEENNTFSVKVTDILLQNSDWRSPENEGMLR